MLRMEGMLKKLNYVPNPTTSTLGFHKNSQTISKIKPKIRIIHIFAPEIIKTDVENFRELVQRLTGKPTENCSTKKREAETRSSAFTRKPISKKKKMEVRENPHSSSDVRERIKGEEEIWRNANSGGGFLGSFPEFDGFMEEFNEFPLIALDASHMDAYGEPQLA